MYLLNSRSANRFTESMKPCLLIRICFSAGAIPNKSGSDILASIPMDASAPD